MPSSSSRRRRRRRRNRKPNPSAATPAPPETRDWAALPRDILIDVFLRLGHCSEIMRGAELVCAAWRHVAVDEPALWRRVDLAAAGTRYYASSLAMARVAVDRSAGQCVAFSGTLDAASLLYLVERAPSLKSLSIQDTELADGVLNGALKKLPLLEDLEISIEYYNTEAENLFASACKACPHLKKLRLTFPEPKFDFDGDREIQDGGVCAIPIMCELRSMELFDWFDLTTDGLAVILENCPLLETQHITGYFLGDDGETYEELRERCAARVKNLILPELDMFYYYHSSDSDW
ncbi:unnamed protein product [Urochloa humidicola]